MASFEEKTIKSFQAAKADVEDFRRSMNEWVIFLDSSLRHAKQQIRALEQRLAELEGRQDMQWR